MKRGNFEGGKGHPIVKYRDTLWSSLQNGRSNRDTVWDNVGSDGSEVLRDIPMATNCRTQFRITGFLGYNSRYMIASDMLFDSRSGFSGSSYPMKT